MRLYPCQDKKVLWLGPGAAAFLKKFSTNTPESPRNAFVDLKGRIVAICEQILTDGDRAALVIEGRFEERLRRHLETYLSLEETPLVTGEELVYFDLDGTHPVDAGILRIPQKRGAILITRKKLAGTVGEKVFTAFRVEQGIPLQGTDFDREMLLCIGDEELVSYTKGCYLGQEILARVHHLGRPPRTLAVEEESEANRGRLTSRSEDPVTGRARGFVWMETAV